MSTGVKADTEEDGKKDTRDIEKEGDKIDSQYS